MLFDRSYLREVVLKKSYKSMLLTLVLALAAVLTNFVAPAWCEEAVYVTPHLISDRSAVVPGQSFKLGIHLDMAEGWHTYYKDPGDAGMKTSVEWHLPPGFKVSELIWQKPEKFVEAGITTYGYHDKTLLAAVVTAPTKLTTGEKLDFKADVKWLSCKDICLPGKGSVELQLPVAAGGDNASSDAEEFKQLGDGFNGSVKDLTSAGTAEKPKAISVLESNYKIDSASSASAGGASLLTFLGFALVGGLILNIMPCVLPVIAIKVMSFLEQAQDSPARVRLLGLTFSAGIISSFLALAFLVIALKAGGQSIGWGFQFQYPGFLIVMCAVVLLMSLSFFGLFYVNITVGQAGIDKLSQGEGFVGTFFKGVLATVLSTPCTAPLLAPALGFAFAEPAYVVLSIFFAAGLGMSLPYLLLTLNPAWLQKLPKPGAWMEKFKQSMGFILLATMVWLDYVLTRQIGAEPASFINYWLVTLAFCAWIVATFTDLTSTGARKAKVYAIAALVLGVVSWLCIFAQPQVMAALSNNSSAERTVTASGDSSGWQPFSVSALNELLTANKTVLLDFTADWCQTCQVNEKTVLSNSAVQAKLKELNVVKMRADWTRQDPDITKLLSKFGRAGVPLYVIFPAGKAQSPIVLPEVITVQMVVDELNKAGKSQ